VSGLSDIAALVVVDCEVLSEKRFMLTSIENVDIEIAVISKTVKESP